MTEGDVWFNTQKTTLHIERHETRYYCGMLKNFGRHTRYVASRENIDFANKLGTDFCRRCVKIKMQWA